MYMYAICIVLVLLTLLWRHNESIYLTYRHLTDIWSHYYGVNTSRYITQVQKGILNLKQKTIFTMVF